MGQGVTSWTVLFDWTKHDQSVSNQSWVSKFDQSKFKKFQSHEIFGYSPPTSSVGVLRDETKGVVATFWHFFAADECDFPVLLSFVDGTCDCLILFSSYFWCMPSAYFVFFLLLLGACHCPILFSFSCWCMWLTRFGIFLLVAGACPCCPIFLHLIAADACDCPVLFSFCCWCMSSSNFVFVLLLVYALILFLFSFCCSRMPLSNFVFVLLCILVHALILFCFLFAAAACPCPILFSFYYWCMPLSYFFFLLLPHALVQFCLFSAVLLLVCALSLFCFASPRSPLPSVRPHFPPRACPCPRMPLSHPPSAHHSRTQTPCTHHSRTHTPYTHHSRTHTPHTSLSQTLCVLFCCSPFVRSYFVFPRFICSDLSLVNDEFVDRLFFIDFVCWLFDSGILVRVFFIY